jgi:TolB-like protein
MKKNLVIMFIILLAFNLFPQDETKKKNEKLIKRTILILPFKNINNVAKYAYLDDTLKNTLKTELLKKDLFNIRTYSNEESELKLDKENLKKTAVKMKSDVYIKGEYIIIDEDIKIIIEAVDVFTGQPVASTHVNGSVGLDIFRIIDQSTKDMADKLSANLKKIKKSYFDEMIRVLRKERQEKILPINKAGIALTACGGSLVLIGFPILIFDVAYYNNVVQNKLYNNPDTDSGYEDYMNAYWTNIALLSSSIAILGTGLCLLAVGLPLIFIKNKNLDFSLNMRMGDAVRFEMLVKM